MDVIPIPKVEALWKCLPERTNSDQTKIGRAGLYLTLLDLTTLGYDAFPAPEGLPYDVIIEHTDRLWRLQVKSTRSPRLHASGRYKNPVYQFHARKAGRAGKRQYRLGSFDGFALAALDRKIVGYMLFDHEVKGTIFCRSKEINYCPNNNTKIAPYIEDLSLASMLKKLETTHV